MIKFIIEVNEEYIRQNADAETSGHLSIRASLPRLREPAQAVAV